MAFRRLNRAQASSGFLCESERKNQDCRSGSILDEAIGYRSPNMMLIFPESSPSLVPLHVHFAGYLSARHLIRWRLFRKMLRFSLRTLPTALQKHYSCLRHTKDGSLAAASCGGGMKRERLCNSGTIPVAVTSTTKAAQSPPLPPAGDGKACRPERVRRPAVLPSFGAFGSKSQTMRSALRGLSARTGAVAVVSHSFPQHRSRNRPFRP